MAAAKAAQLQKPAVGLAVFLTLSAWIFGIIAVVLWCILDVVMLPRRGAAASLAFKLLLVALPLRLPPPAPVRRFLRFSLAAAADYFPVRVVFEGCPRADYADGPFVIGYEPHSVLPQGMCTFSHYARPDVVPAALRDCRILVSSAGLWVPIMRHLWWWWGCRPVSRASFQSQLAKGRSVALCPGGVMECLYMERGREVAYLRKRSGFVRLALQAGAPLVPVFAFGQSDFYGYCRVFHDWPQNVIPRSRWASFVRRIGYVPMLIWGLRGSFMPRRVPLYIAVGKPLVVPRLADPTPAQVQHHLSLFIADMERLFLAHRAAAGYPSTELTIY